LVQKAASVYVLDARAYQRFAAKFYIRLIACMLATEMLSKQAVARNSCSLMDGFGSFAWSAGVDEAQAQELNKARRQ